jgi:hypothetical protein
VNEFLLFLILGVLYLSLDEISEKLTRILKKLDGGK